MGCCCARRACTASAAQHANEANNLHSLAVQMRPVLECAGQVVTTLHNLLIVGGERGMNASLGIHDAHACRFILWATKGRIGYEELLELIASTDAEVAAQFGVTRIRSSKPRRRSSRLADKVAVLDGGKFLYDQLSERFCHGRADWQGASLNGGVVSMDTDQDAYAFAGLMDFLANYMVVMNAYAGLVPCRWRCAAWLDARMGRRDAGRRMRSEDCVPGSSRRGDDDSVGIQQRGARNWPRTLSPGDTAPGAKVSARC